MIRVFLADDHTLFREGVRRVLEANEGIRVVGEAGEAAEVLARVSRATCDVLVLDLAMPGGGGLEVLRRLRERDPKPGVIILSMYAEDQYAIRLLRAGASAYLTKGRSASELVAAVRKVAAGGRYLTETIAEQALGAPDDAAPHTRLSNREQQIFQLLAQGKTPSEIAAQLDLKPSTVSTYIARIKDALDAQSIGDIVRYAARAGLLG